VQPSAIGVTDFPTFYHGNEGVSTLRGKEGMVRAQVVMEDSMSVVKTLQGKVDDFIDPR
jgi:hypothetical protein